MVNYKKRVEKLEGKTWPGEPVIMLDEVDGVLYRNGEQTTIAEIREHNKDAILFIDDIPKEYRE